LSSSSVPAPKVESEHSDLGRRTASGLSWQAFASLTSAVSSFAFGVALARLLLPEDFGIIGIALLATGFVNVVADLGLGPSLIQQRAISERHVRVCHTISMAMAVLMTLALVGTADFIASLFGDARVAPVLKALAIASLLKGFSITSGALLVRRLAFRTTVRIELVSSIIGYGGVAVAMAVAGYGYWSLVGGMLAQTAFSGVLTYSAERHNLRPLVASSEIRDLIGFSVGMSLTSTVNYFALRGDYFVVGRLMNATNLGFYSRAYTLMELPLVVFGSALNRVLFPAASRVQDDAERFRRAYLTIFSLSTAVALPISLALVVLAPELIITLYGAAWAPTVPLLQILCLFGIFRMTYNTASTFLRARGQMYRLLVCTLLYGTLVVGGSWWAGSIGGLAGVAWAVGGAITCMWLLVVGFANRAAGVSIGQFAREFARAAAPGLVVAVGLALLVTGMRLAEVPALVRLAVAVATFGVAFAVTFHMQARRFDHPAINTFLDRIRSQVFASGARLRRMFLRAEAC
jgi:O-antigen/teichoic acid export membrane protein